MQQQPVAFVLRNDSRYTVVLRRDHTMGHWDTSYTLKPHDSVMVDAMPGEHFRLAQMSAGIAYGVEPQHTDSYTYGEFRVPADAAATMQGGTVPVYRVTENNFTQREPMPDGNHMLTIVPAEGYMHESPKASLTSMTTEDYAYAIGAGLGAAALAALVVYLVMRLRRR